MKRVALILLAVLLYAWMNRYTPAPDGKIFDHWLGRYVPREAEGPIVGLPSF